MNAETITKIITVLGEISERTELTEEEEKYINIAIGLLVTLVH